MSSGKKVAAAVAATIVVVVAALVIMVPRLLDLDRYRPQVAAEIGRKTGKPARIGRLELTLFPLVAIRVDEFGLGNPPGFPPGEVVAVKKIYARVNPLALVHHRVEITSLELDSPAVELLKDTRGKWNFESPPGPATGSPAPRGSGSFTLGTIPKLKIVDGQFVAANLEVSGARGALLVEIRGAAIDLRQVDLGAFTAGAPASQPPGPGEAAAASRENAPLAPSGVPAAEGALKAGAVQFGTLAVQRLRAQLRLYPGQVFLEKLEMKCYGGRALGTVAVGFGGPSVSYATNARLEGINMAALLNAFPEARGKITGLLQGNAQITGMVTQSSADPLAGITGSGLVSIGNGQLPSLELNRNLRMLALVVGLATADTDPSSFKSISADFKIAEGRLSSSGIALASNGLDVRGGGSMTLAGAGTLDYQGSASLTIDTRNPIAGVVAGIAGAKVSGNTAAFPFTIGGTLAKPSFSLKGTPGRGIAPASLQPQADQLVRGLAGLLKKKQH